MPLMDHMHVIISRYLVTGVDGSHRPKILYRVYASVDYIDTVHYKGVTYAICRCAHNPCFPIYFARSIHQ